MGRESDRARGYRALGSAKRWTAGLSIVATAAFAGLAAKATHARSPAPSSGDEAPVASGTSDDGGHFSEDGGSGFFGGGSGFFGGGSAPAPSQTPPAASSGGS